jgi:hypothetical protein
VADGILRRADVDRLRRRQTSPGIERIGAEDGPRRFRPARADQPASPGSRRAGPRTRRSPGSSRAGPGLPSRVSLRRESATSPGAAASRWANSAFTSRPTIIRMMPSIVVRRRAARHEPAVAQHRVAVADLHHLFQPVSDEDDAEPAAFMSRMMRRASPPRWLKAPRSARP